MPIHAFVMHQKLKPVMSAFSDGGPVRTYPLFLKGVGLNLATVYASIEAIKKELAGVEKMIPLVLLNDFKSLIEVLRPTTQAFNVYDYGIIKEPDYGNVSLEKAKEICIKCVQRIQGVEPMPWMKLLGKATQVYHALQRRGVMNGYAHVYPQFLLNTVSGRSKTIGFNIQGTDATFDIRHPDEEKTYFVHLDWISADLKAAQLLSSDQFLADAFKKSDPYSVMAKGDLTRADCKLMMIRALYEMDHENPALQFWPTLQQWVVTRRKFIEEHGYSESVLGRKFKMVTQGDALHNMRSVFNAALQGTVVHAMHNALWQIHKVIPNNILAETHDAIVLAADRHSVRDVMKIGIEAMLHPLQGVLEDNPTFPLKVCVGRRWKRWKLYKEVR